MAETTDTPPKKRVPVPAIDGEEFPQASFPTIFADGISGVATGWGVAKFYLFRIDPSAAGNGTINPNIFMQIAMPVPALVGAALFFEQQIKGMIERKEISQETVDQLRATANMAVPVAKP